MAGERGLISQQTILSYSKTGSTYTELEGTQSFPDIGGETENVETTTLKSKQKTYISGIPDPGDMEFEMLYLKTEFQALQDLKGEDIDWKLTFPDDTTVSWKGQCSVRMAGKGVSEALTYSLKITPSSEIEWDNV